MFQLTESAEFCIAEFDYPIKTLSMPISLKLDPSAPSYVE